MSNSVDENGRKAVDKYLDDLGDADISAGIGAQGGIRGRDVVRELLEAYESAKQPVRTIDETDWQIVEEGGKHYVKVELGVMNAYRQKQPVRVDVGACAKKLDYNAFACEGKEAERPADKQRRARAVKQAKSVLSVVKDAAKKMGVELVYDN